MSELLEAEVVVDGVRLDTADVTAVRAAVSNMLALIFLPVDGKAFARRNKTYFKITTCSYCRVEKLLVDAGNRRMQEVKEGKT